MTRSSELSEHALYSCAYKILFESPNELYGRESPIYYTHAALRAFFKRAACEVGDDLRGSNWQFSIISQNEPPSASRVYFLTALRCQSPCDSGARRLVCGVVTAAERHEFHLPIRMCCACTCTCTCTCTCACSISGSKKSTPDCPDGARVGVRGRGRLG